MYFIPYPVVKVVTGSPYAVDDDSGHDGFAEAFAGEQQQDIGSEQDPYSVDYGLDEGTCLGFFHLYQSEDTKVLTAGITVSQEIRPVLL